MLFAVAYHQCLAFSFQPGMCRGRSRNGKSKMTAFWISLFFVFAAEMGDKTQLVALAFATRYKAWIVLTAVFVATLLVHLFSVFLGEAASFALPVFWIKMIAGASFIFFGLWTLRGDELDEEETAKPSRFGPLVTIGVTFFLAELGDKTMLMTVTIASQQNSFVAVWLGSSLGMVVADGLAIIVGKVMGKNLPEKMIKYGAAIIFIFSGVYTFYEAFANR
jgi:putative Ca2+/H+ antiporter (TMEM165/GDT1 family)